MRILVIGGGGREHALVWKLRQGAGVEHVWCAPGNAGISQEAECVGIEAGDVAALVAFAEKSRPDLTVVGPELPLVNGLTDAFLARGWAVVGPSHEAARLEGSKIFSKEFLLRHGIPTAKMYGAFARPEEARAALNGVKYPVVLKADGLCAGKGVVVAASEAEAQEFVTRAMERKEFGAGGERVLIEEGLRGDELSFIILTDGTRFAAMAPTRDHKRVFDKDEGPNTGGMGAYSADDLLAERLRAEIVDTIVEPTLRGLATDGIAYSGFLYVGVMLTAEGPKVLEFNCRLGDPETQPIVMRMDFDLAAVLTGLAAGRFKPGAVKWKAGTSACVVLASGGYPGKFTTGRPIKGLTSLTEISGVKVFHSGTRFEENQVVTSGGRVLGVTAVGSSVAEALERAYEAAGHIKFEGMHYRRDIGGQAGRVQVARS